MVAFNANKMDPDQTAPSRSSLIRVHTVWFHDEISLECIYTLKVPRKNASEKLRLLKSSAANNCLILLTNSGIEENRVDPDQTAPVGAV